MSGNSCRLPHFLRPCTCVFPIYFAYMLVYIHVCSCIYLCSCLCARIIRFFQYQNIRIHEKTSLHICICTDMTDMVPDACKCICTYTHFCMRKLPGSSPLKGGEPATSPRPYGRRFPEFPATLHHAKLLTEASDLVSLMMIYI